MARGFALVALRQDRRAEESEKFKKILEEIQTLVKANPQIVDIKAVMPIDRIHGSTEILAGFKVRIDVEASDLKRAFVFMEDQLHGKGYSHLEGYGG